MVNIEFTREKIVILKFGTKSFTYTALSIMAALVIIMDISKYYFSIDPVSTERVRCKQEKHKKKPKPMIQRFIYVNTPPSI